MGEKPLTLGLVKAQNREGTDLTGFLRIGVGLWLATMLGGLALGWRVSLGLAIGGGLSLLLFLSQVWAVRAAAAGPLTRFKRRLLMLWALKFPLVGVMLYLLLRFSGVDTIAFCASLGLMPIAITMSALGHLVWKKWRSPFFVGVAKREAR